MDLKKRVAIDHPDWDLSGYRGAEFDYSVDEAAKEAPMTTPPIVVQEEVGGTDNTPVDPATDTTT